MAEITVNEGLSWMKTLRERHTELTELRNVNSATVRRRYGLGGDKDETRDPTYDVKELDKLITRVAREMKKLDQALKATNAVTKVVGYDQSDEVLGEVV
jgi:hypothetical protein